MKGVCVLFSQTAVVCNLTMINAKIKTKINKVLNWLLEKWLAGFVTASIFFMVNLYLNLPKETRKDFFSFNWFIDIMVTPIKFFYVVILIFLILIINKAQKSFNKKKTIKKVLHDFQEYNKDKFGSKKTIWTWNYQWNLNKSFSIVNLKPSCPICMASLNINSFNSADCSKCRLEGKPHKNIVNESISDVEDEIFRRINSGEYKK